MRRTIAILIGAAAVAAGQIPGGLDVGSSMRQNAEALKHYSYKRRTEITVKGQSRGARVDLVRYIGGKIETVPLETPPRPQIQQPRGLRGKIVESKIEHKKEEMKEERERLEDLLHSYLAPGSDAMHKLLEKAAISRIGTGTAADIKIVATGVRMPHDSFTLIWSVSNHRPVSVNLQSQLDGKSVLLTVDYAALADGVFYAARTMISMPKKETVIRIENFDYSNS
ncbi:MAG TPA: hypothetical protein VHW24_14135 [Bryobacteraceae bacterium]|nr:hypothetical protein [Bryobacteraceae bacterium]